MNLSNICEFLDNELCLSEFDKDCSNNGLQLEGCCKVSSMIFAVDASLELFEIAVERDADLIFVHHGISWGDTPRRFTGTVAKRLRTLFANGISLYAAHLPLDAHEKYGNNAQLSNIIDLQNRSVFFEYASRHIGVCGELAKAKSTEKIADIYAKTLNCRVKSFGRDKSEVKKIAVVSGGAGSDAISDAAKNQCDMLITGEVTHASYHVALENNISVLALGHYASEKPGPLAMMKLVDEKFALQCEFIDIPTSL